MLNRYKSPYLSADQGVAMEVAMEVAMGSAGRNHSRCSDLSFFVPNTMPAGVHVWVHNERARCVCLCVCAQADEHESMESLKIIDTQPIDLYKCFKAFVREDQLGDEESW